MYIDIAPNRLVLCITKFRKKKTTTTTTTTTAPKHQGEE
jgi:hypothetical protein